LETLVHASDILAAIVVVGSSVAALVAAALVLGRLWVRDLAFDGAADAGVGSQVDHAGGGGLVGDLAAIV
jgi:hypothetical protein